MPRNPGTGVYSKPSPDVITGTTIESTVYNTFVGDVETDLNTARPVSSGGTGATSADGALVNVSGEKAAQLVTDYNTHVWFPGSFRSAAAAAGAPNATSSFVGTAYINEALANPPTNQNVVLEARDQNDTGYVPGRTYVREKKAGVWSAWTGGIYAAPFDAMAYSGMQVNGGMEVSQENGAAGITFVGTQTKFLLDGWVGQAVLTTGQISMNQQVLPTEVPGFKNCLQIGVTVGTAAIGSDYVRLSTRIEGYRFMRMAWGTANAKPLTIGFWARASVAGIYKMFVTNFDNSLITAVVPFTLAGGAVFQWVAVTVPAQTTGVWKADNTIGAVIIIETASSGTANTITTGGYFSITGVIVLPGTQAPTAAQSPLIMRPYDQELVTCQRYWNKLAVNGRFFAAGANHYIVSPVYYPPMRTIPTFAFLSAGSQLNILAGSPVIATVNNSSGYFQFGSNGAGDCFSTGTIISLDARL